MCLLGDREREWIVQKKKKKLDENADKNQIIIPSLIITKPAVNLIDFFANSINTFPCKQCFLTAGQVTHYAKILYSFSCRNNYNKKLELNKKKGKQAFGK